MKKKIELSIEEAKELYKTASPEFKTLLEHNFTQSELRGSITDRVKSWEDVVIMSPAFRLPYPNPEDCNEIQHNSLAKLMRVVKVLNEDWTPNWKNEKEYKYAPYVISSAGSWSVSYGGWSSFCYFPSGLVLKSKELCEHLIKHFKSLIIEAYL